MKPETIHIGDFVYCRSRYYREQLGLPESIGIVLENKRANYKVLYERDKRCWMPRDVMGRVRAPEKPEPVAGVLHYLIKRLKAQECELVVRDAVFHATLRIDRIDAAAVDEIRSRLASGFVSLAVVPEGMAFMSAEIAFQAGPAAATPLL